MKIKALRTGLIALVSMSSLANATAPLCSAVFTEKVQIADVDGAVNALADMKLRLDIAQAQGQQNGSLQQMLRTEFFKKWNELKRYSTLKPDELNNQLKKRIERLQNKENESKKSEQTLRDEQALTMAPRAIDLGTALRLPSHQTTMHQPFLHYFKEDNSILFSDSSGSLSKIQLNVKAEPPVRIQGAFGLLPDRKSVLAVDEQGQISILNPLGKVEKQVGQIPKDLLSRMGLIRDSSIVVSPNGETMALVSQGDVVFFNLKTQGAWRFTDQVNGFKQQIAKVSFLNNSTAHVYPRLAGSELEFVSVNMKNKEVSYPDFGISLHNAEKHPQAAKDLLLTEDMDSYGRSTLNLVTTTGKAATVKPLLSIYIGKEKVPAISIQGIPGTNMIIMSRTVRDESKIEIYRLGEKNPVYEFKWPKDDETELTQKVISAVHISDDRRSAVITYQEFITDHEGSLSSRNRMEIWALPNSLQ